MFTSNVNVAFINEMFAGPRFALMHESLERLLTYAREATSHLQSAKQIKEQADLKQRLGATSQAMYNWQTRGLSEPVAIQAEGEFGCSAVWLLTGKSPPGWPQHPRRALLSEDFLTALSTMGADAVRRAENAARAAVDLEPLPRVESRKRLANG